jgi:hypothetical protein
MADIFLSYSSKDKDRVRPLVLALEREGWSVWWDRKTPAGETFDFYCYSEAIRTDHDSLTSCYPADQL